jgi:hypothetical protein
MAARGPGSYCMFNTLYNMQSDIFNAVCFCVVYLIWLRKRQHEDDMAALAAAHAAGDTMGQKGNMDLAFLRQVSSSYRIRVARCCSSAENQGSAMLEGQGRMPSDDDIMTRSSAAAG